MLENWSEFRKHWVFWICFLLLVVFGSVHHELWLDEMHHYLLGRDSKGFIDLLSVMRYEGHPVLWNYLAYLGSLVYFDPNVVKILNTIIIALAAAVFLSFENVPRHFKYLFLLGYFPLY